MNLYFTLITIITYGCYVFAQSDEYYMGAVVEYNPLPYQHEIPSKYMHKNINEYEKLVKEAKKQKADIIVFPEYGLTTTNVQNNLNEYVIDLPDPQIKIIACNNTDYTKILQRLSCIAKDSSIYLVVNLPEKVNDPNNKNTAIYYNTNIVFDRNGVLIARYRKTNLFEESYFKTPEKPELTYFETDFGVTFGTFTCFDILFTKPSIELLRHNKNITDIVYPTAWLSQLPFLTAVQTQFGWAQAYGVNLLAAGYNNPKNYFGGSGIYAGGEIEYALPVQNKTQLIIRKIQKQKSRTITISKNGMDAVNNNSPKYHSSDLNVLKENMTKYETSLLKTKQNDFKMCHRNLCCSFNITFTPSVKPDYYYRLFVYDGMRSMGDVNKSVQLCGLAACKDQTVESCGDLIRNVSNPVIFDEISISGDFLDRGSSVIFPTQVLYDFSCIVPSNYIFNSVKKTDRQNILMKTTTQVKEVLGFGIYSVISDSHDIPVPDNDISGWLILLYIVMGLTILVLVSLIAVYVIRSKKSDNFKNLFKDRDSD